MAESGTVDASVARNVRLERVGMPHDGDRLRGPPERASLHPVSDARPTNVGNERQGPIAHGSVAAGVVVSRSGNVGVVDVHGPATNEVAGNEPPEPAVHRAKANV